jgi:hypothetical protein
MPEKSESWISYSISEFVPGWTQVRSTSWAVPSVSLMKFLSHQSLMYNYIFIQLEHVIFVLFISYCTTNSIPIVCVMACCSVLPRLSGQLIVFAHSFHLAFHLAFIRDALWIGSFFHLPDIIFSSLISLIDAKIGSQMTNCYLFQGLICDHHKDFIMVHLGYAHTDLFYSS